MRTFGKLRGLAIVDFVGVVAIGVEMVQLEFYVIAAARLVLGFVIGISTAIIPVYISSISPPTMLGKLGTYNQLLQCSGVVLAYILGSILDNNNP